MIAARLLLAAALAWGEGGRDAARSSSSAPPPPTAERDEDGEVIADLDLLLNLDEAADLELLRELAGEGDAQDAERQGDR